MFGLSNVVNKENCPGGKCPIMTITRTSGTAGTIDCYNAAYVDGPYKKAEDSTSPIPTKSAGCTIASAPAGYGAPADPSQYPTGKFNLTCVEKPTYPAPVSIGCFIDDHYRDLPYDLTELPRSMTIEFCTSRCYQRNYTYAALQNAFKCYCGNFYGAYGEASGECTKNCSGNDAQTCGANNRNSVYATGRAVIPDLETCGTDCAGAVIDGSCYCLTSDSGIYTDGQRACVKFGGNLATITSGDIQAKVVQYMRPKIADAWFGLNDNNVEGTLEYVDGTAVGNYNNTVEYKGNADTSDGYILKAKALYGWSNRAMSESHKALCRTPLQATAPVGESCGTNNLGKKFGSGACYTVINTPMNLEDSKYACYTRMGKLVTVDAQNRDEIIKHIYVFGDSMDYWTGEVGAGDEPYELDDAKLYSKATTTQGNMNGAVCLLEIVSAANPCSVDWVKSGDTCYLYTGMLAGSFEKARSLCQQGVSDMLVVDSAAVTDFLVQNIAETNRQLYIGINYKTATNTFERIDGSQISYTNWKSGEGDDNKSNGKCARVKISDGLWRNRICNKNGFVMCTAPAGK